MSLAPGTRLGPYEILAPLGAGGMGEVHRARDTRLERDVAVKALPEAVARDPLRVARFEREAKLLASLHHPNIGAIFGLEEVDGHRYLVLEFVEGETLAARLARGALPADEALAVCAQIATAVEAAHEAGVVHRDLKPGNVMLKPDGTVKVLDFGLAKATSAESASGDVSLSASPTVTYAATAVGVILGTAAYMSPEQARGRAVDRRADIWAFGCVLYECLAGRRAFEGDTTSDLVARILEREPDWSALPASVPEPVSRLLRRCLTKDARERLRDIGEARIALAEAKTPGARAQAPARSSRWPRARIPVLVVLAIVAAIAVLTFGVTRRLLSPRAATNGRIAHVSIVLPEGYELGSSQLTPVAISHDGARLAYVGQKDGKNRIFVHAMEETEANALDGTEGGDGPFFSPDGQWIGFFAGSKLWKIAVSGAALQSLADAPSHRGGDWGDDGFIYFAPTNMGGIWRVPEGGGAATAVTQLDQVAGEISHRWPHRVAGTKALLFASWTGPGDDEHHVAVQTMGASEHTLLIKGGDAPQYVANPSLLLYTHRGQLFTVPWQPPAPGLGKAVPVAATERPNDGIGNEGCGNYAVSDDGTLAYITSGGSYNAQRLVWVSRYGAITPLPLPERAYENVMISPDGGRAMVQIREGTTRLWMYDFGRGTLTPLVTGPGSSQAPKWTADGLRVIYRGTRQGTRNLYWIAVDGSGSEERLTTKPGVIQTPTSVSADGRVLLFDEAGPEEPLGTGIWVLRLDGDHTPHRLFPLPVTGRDGQLSPDSRWVAYQTTVASRQEIFVAPFSGPGERRLVSTDGGTEPLWSRDGRELFFQSGNQLMGVNVTPGATFSASPPQPMYEGRFFRTITGNTSFSITNDSARFLRIQPLAPEPAITHIELVLNWFSELRRRAAGRPE